MSRENDARFDDKGSLEIFKNGRWWKQYCPHSDDSQRCGLWCPQCYIHHYGDRKVPNVFTCSLREYCQHYTLVEYTEGE